MARIYVDMAGLEVVNLQHKDGDLRQLVATDKSGDEYVLTFDEQAAASTGLKLQGIGIVTPDGPTIVGGG